MGSKKIRIIFFNTKNIKVELAGIYSLSIEQVILELTTWLETVGTYEMFITRRLQRGYNQPLDDCKPITESFI